MNELDRDWSLWSRFRPLTKQLVDLVGMPSSGIEFAGFLGNYRRTPFGIHKDHAHVITFVIEGHKKMLLWPFESFADRPEVLRDAKHKTTNIVVRDRAEYADLVKSAIRLEGGPGSVMYWPPSFWHQSDDADERTITLALGFQVGPPCFTGMEIPGLEMRHFLKDTGPKGLPKQLLSGLVATSSRALREQQSSIRTGWLEFISRGGYSRCPAPGPAPSLDPGDHVEFGGWPILIDNLTSSEAVIAANGQSIRFPIKGELQGRFARVVKLLNGGKPHRVEDLVRIVSGDRSTEDLHGTKLLLELLCSWRALHLVTTEQLVHKGTPRRTGARGAR